MTADLKWQITKLAPQSGDVVVARFKERLTEEAAAHIKALFRGAFPDQKVLVIDSSCDLALLTKAEIEARVSGDL